MIIPWIWLIIAFVLLFLEFYLPGGIMATIAIVFFLLSFVHSYQAYGIAGSMLFFAIAVVGGGAVIWFALLNIRKSKNTFFLQDDQEGYEGSEKRPEYIGKAGVAASDLGPAGFAMIEGKRMQVICQEGYVEKGEDIVVIDSRGGYLIVSPNIPK